MRLLRYTTTLFSAYASRATLGEMMNTVKWSLADVYHQMGKNEQAVILYEDVLEIQDTLKSRKARNTALELAAIYHDNEQHQIIMQQEAENTRNRFVIILVVAAMIGLLFYAEKEARQKRAISLKNQSLAAQITETLNYKKLYWDEKRAQAMADVPDDLNTLDDSSLFHHISEVIVRERLYLNPNFGRDVIMERFQLTKERVGTIFAKGSEYAKISSYILQLRLEFAAHVLVHHPERSIVQVATDSGFSSSSYFSTCFRQHFGISPTDYRRDAPDLKSETVV